MTLFCERNAQTTRHIVEECQKTRFEGEVTTIHEYELKAVKWLESLEVRLQLSNSNFIDFRELILFYFAYLTNDVNYLFYFNY